VGDVFGPRLVANDDFQQRLCITLAAIQTRLCFPQMPLQALYLCTLLLLLSRKICFKLLHLLDIALQALGGPLGLCSGGLFSSDGRTQVPCKLLAGVEA